MTPYHQPHFSSGHIRSPGFTLVELIVVVAILLVLSSIIFPNIGNYLNSAKSTGCLSNMRGLGLAHVLDSTDNKDKVISVHQYLPWQGGPAESWLVKEGYATPEQYLCPLDEGKRREPPYPWGSSRPIDPPSFSYTRNIYVDSVYRRRIPDIPHPDRMALLLEEYELAPMNDPYVLPNTWDLMTQRHRGRGGMAYVSGNAEFIDTIEFNLAPGAWRRDRYFLP